MAGASHHPAPSGIQESRMAIWFGEIALPCLPFYPLLRPDVRIAEAALRRTEFIPFALK
jgi:hypothetical protein